MIQVSHEEAHELAALGLGSRLLVAEVLRKDVADAFHSFLGVLYVRANRRKTIHEIFVPSVDAIDIAKR